MSDGPRLIAVNRPASPRAAVVVLHGGAARRRAMMVSPAQLSVVRMIPIARRIARRGGDELAVFRLLNTYRGWDTSHTPLDDVRWALDEVRTRVGERPTGLVGHSLGGRAALLAGGTPGVESVVALAPWLYEDDDADLTGRRVLIVHGGRDRIAPPQRSAALARRLARRTGAHGSVGYIRIAGGKHAMLSHHAEYDGFAAAFTTAVLLPGRDLAVPGPVREVLDGSALVEV